MEMADEDLGGPPEPEPGLHHAALGSLAAVEEEDLPVPLQRDCGCPPTMGGLAAAGSEEYYLQRGTTLVYVIV